MKSAFAIMLLSGAALAAPVASADVLESVRLGVMDHNIRVIDPKNADKESGVNINGQINFHSPKFLDFAFSPKPFIMGSVNTDGNTSYGGVGLEWDWEFVDGWHIEPSFGYVLHDGAIDLPYPSGDPRNQAFTDNNVLMGSKDVFRSSLALTLDFSEDWGAQVIYEHLSHGQILGSGRNQGLDELGVRFVYRFD